jgi:hypothetical protein
MGAGTGVGAAAEIGIGSGVVTVTGGSANMGVGNETGTKVVSTLGNCVRNGLLGVANWVLTASTTANGVMVT